MIGRAHHLNDDRLFEHYLAGRSGDLCDVSALDHLGACAECRERLTALTTLFDGIREDADEAADDI